jgi:hypothetical protein
MQRIRLERRSGRTGPESFRRLSLENLCRQDTDRDDPVRDSSACADPDDAPALNPGRGSAPRPRIGQPRAARCFSRTNRFSGIIVKENKFADRLRERVAAPHRRVRPGAGGRRGCRGRDLVHGWAQVADAVRGVLRQRVPQGSPTEEDHPIQTLAADEPSARARHASRSQESTARSRREPAPRTDPAALAQPLTET